MAIRWEDVDDEGLEGDVAVNVLNRVSRRIRHRRYQRRIKNQPDAIRIVSEGDSWFQYPLILDDVVDQLFNRYAIYSLGAGGDLFSEMIDQDEVIQAIVDQSPQVVMFSGGGNDLVGNGRLSTTIHRYDEGRAIDDYPNEKFDELLDRIRLQYRNLFKRIIDRFPNIRILCHSYDWPIPKNGKWLGRPLASIGIEDEKLQADIVRVVIDRFDHLLQSIVRDFNGIVSRVDCRGAVDATQWYDELHPTDKGFSTIAERFANAIELVTGGEEGIYRVTARLCPGVELRVPDARDLDAGSFNRVVARRARALVHADMDVHAADSTRRECERAISRFYEKIHRGSEFLPAQYLERGAQRAKAVCRISTPTSRGTGFLVASRQYIMTNNHVLPDVETAKLSVAEFDFTVGANSRRVTLDPRRLFITDVSLDFSIVACDEDAVSEVIPIPLLRNPATVTREERVNIIQHPSGRRKEIAIHDNKVTRLMDKVIHYRTDTEPGSSGAPVFNNEWDLVALHHAGWSEHGGRATNEGIRVAAIVSHLAARSRKRAEGSRESATLLDLVPDSSPLLGFFDLDGVVDGDALDFDIVDSRGSKCFADFGFWRVDHFDVSASRDRIERVADVIERLSMDILGLYDVEAPALERLAKTLGGRGSALGFELPTVSGCPNLAVIYDRDTSTVLLDEAAADRHRQRIDVRTSTGRRVFPQAPLFARCTVAGDSAKPVEFMMIIVRFKAFGNAWSPERRHLAATALVEILVEERNSQQVPIVMGCDSIELLNSHVLGLIDGVPDLLGVNSDDGGAEAAYIGNRYESLIDQIVVSGDVSTRSASDGDLAILQIERTVHDFSGGASKHVPVVMRVISRTYPVRVPDADTAAPVVDVPIPSDADSLSIEFKSRKRTGT